MDREVVERWLNLCEHRMTDGRATIGEIADVRYGLLMVLLDEGYLHSDDLAVRLAAESEVA